MKFQKGSEVVFKHSGDFGEILKALPGNMWLVYIEKHDMEIPCFEDDIELKSMMQKASINISASNTNLGVISKGVSTDKNEFSLAFKPIYEKDSISEFDVLVMNETQKTIIFDIAIFDNKDELIFDNSDILKAGEFKVIGVLELDDLNNGLVVESECSMPSTDNQPLKAPFQEIKIKAQQFFKKKKYAELLSQELYIYTLEHTLEEKKNNIDLKDYTKQNIQKPSSKSSNFVFKDNKYLHLSKNEIFEFANFDTELDLHIEKLVKDYSKMSNRDILSIQMNRFYDYISKASRLGVPKIFIIHGVGKGKLKETLHEALESDSDVEYFKNEYHPKYGFGATEVFLKSLNV